MLKREQYAELQNIRVRDGESKRIDCMFCSGKKTLTVSRLDGKLVWNCYKASCDAKGGKRVGRTTDNIKAKLADSEYKQTVKKWTHPLPSVSSYPDNHPRVISYLEANHSHKAYKDHAIRVTYDPVKDRVLFWMNDNLGAVGRTLSKNGKPKWLSYGDTSGLLQVGKSTTAIVVEDAASACAVYTTGIYTGVALLGTHVTKEQKSMLKDYDNVIVCLDKDASAKALRLSRSLSSVVSTTVRLLEEDFKYMEPEHILSVLN